MFDSSVCGAMQFCSEPRVSLDALLALEQLLGDTVLRSRSEVEHDEEPVDEDTNPAESVSSPSAAANVVDVAGANQGANDLPADVALARRDETSSDNGHDRTRSQ
jgi:hypothetical protein